MELKDTIKASVSKQADLIEKINVQADKTFDAFRDVKRKWSTANLRTIRKMHQSYRAKVAHARVGIMKDIHTAQSHDVSTVGLMKNLENAAVVSAKLDSLIVTATSSLREKLSNKDVVTMDENGVVQSSMEMDPGTTMKKESMDHDKDMEDKAGAENEAGAETEAAGEDKAGAETEAAGEDKAGADVADFGTQHYSPKDKMKDIERDAPDPLFDNPDHPDPSPMDEDEFYSRVMEGTKDDYMSSEEVASSMQHDVTLPTTRRDNDAGAETEAAGENEAGAETEAAGEDKAGAETEAAGEDKADMRTTVESPTHTRDNDAGADKTETAGKNRSARQVGIAEFIEDTASDANDTKAIDLEGTEAAGDDEAKTEAARKERAETRRRTATKESNASDLADMERAVFSEGVLGEHTKLRVQQ